MNKVTRVSMTAASEGRRIEVRKNLTLREAFKASGVNTRSLYGGRGVCGKCKIIIKEQTQVSEPTDNETRLLTSTEINLGLRLACQTIIQSNLTVVIPIKSRVKQRQIQIEGMEVSFELNPAVRKLRIQSLSPSFFDNTQTSRTLLSFLEKN